MINSSILNQKDCLKGVLRRVGLTPVQFWLHLYSSGDVIYYVCGQETKNNNKKYTHREGDINLPGSRWDVTENRDLRGSQAGSRLRGRKANIGLRRTWSGSCRMLETRPGSVCVPVCVWIFVSFLCCWVSVCQGCSACVFVCLKMPSQTPLLWGGNGQ